MKKKISVLLLCLVICFSSIPVFAAEGGEEPGTTTIRPYFETYLDTEEYLELSNVTPLLLSRLSISNSYLNPGSIQVLVLNDSGAVVIETIVNPGKSTTTWINVLAGPYTIYAKAVSEPGFYDITIETSLIS